MNKSELRKIYKEKRNELQRSDLEKMQDLLLIRFQKLDLPFISIVHTYIPLIDSNEPDPHNIVRWLSFRNPGLICAAPVADFKAHTMRHFVFDENTELRINPYGIPEPADGEQLNAKDFDMVIVPLLAFDEHGYRVGYGKGFYDRFLADCRSDVICIGLSFFNAVKQIADTNTFDRRMDYCITPERIYEF